MILEVQTKEKNPGKRSTSSRKEEIAGDGDLCGRGWLG